MFKFNQLTECPSGSVCCAPVVLIYIFGKRIGNQLEIYIRNDFHLLQRQILQLVFRSMVILPLIAVQRIFPSKDRYIHGIKGYKILTIFHNFIIDFQFQPFCIFPLFSVRNRPNNHWSSLCGEAFQRFLSCQCSNKTKVPPSKQIQKIGSH